MPFRDFLPTMILSIVCGLLGAVIFVGTLVAFWQIIVPLASPSAQDWRHFVSGIAGDVFPVFWTFALYLISALSASVFLPKKALEGRLVTVCVIVYVAYAAASLSALYAVHEINSEGASLMSGCLLNPIFYPIGILVSMPVALAIFFIRRIQPWNAQEGKRLLLIVPVTVVCLAAALYFKKQ
jgi:hypothetical protein